MPPAIPVVESLYRQYGELVTFLQVRGETSLSNLVNDNFRKTLLLASASWFETELVNIVVDFASFRSEDDSELVSLVKSRFDSRSYSALFDWDGKNVNGFLKRFGKDLSDKCILQIKGDATLQQSVRDFLELGRLRNQLVHDNYAAFTLEKTTDEIHSTFMSASRFLAWLRNLLTEPAENVAEIFLG